MMHALPSSDPPAAVKEAAAGNAAAVRFFPGADAAVGGLGVAPTTKPLAGVAPLPALATALAALHTFLWPPSFQCVFWHTTEQYHTCTSLSKSAHRMGRRAVEHELAVRTCMMMQESVKLTHAHMECPLALHSCSALTLKH